MDFPFYQTYLYDIYNKLNNDIEKSLISEEIEKIKEYQQNQPKAKSLPGQFIMTYEIKDYK